MYTINMEYKDLSSAAARLGERNDCSVRAVTVVTGLDYAVVHDMFRAAGRKKGKGTPRHLTYAVLHGLGYTTENVTGNFKARTVCTLEREMPCFGKYLVWTSGHILGVRQGKVLDWTAGRRHRVVRIEKVSYANI